MALAAIAERLDGEGTINTVFWNHAKTNLKDLLSISFMNFGENILKSIKVIKNIEEIEKC